MHEPVLTAAPLGGHRRAAGVGLQYIFPVSKLLSPQARGPLAPACMPTGSTPGSLAAVEAARRPDLSFPESNWAVSTDRGGPGRAHLLGLARVGWGALAKGPS